MNVLVLGNLWERCADFLVFLLEFAALDGVVMDLEVSGQQQHLLLAEETNTETIRVWD